MKTNAQSCCSGGVPISNNLGLPLTDIRTIQLALSYDLNILNTLKAGSEKLDDNSRKRLTHSILMQAGYRISKKWSSEIFLSYVKQKRIIKQFGNRNVTMTNGLGDAVILFKYHLASNSSKQLNWLIGAGPKFPTGSSDQKDNNNIALNADLQPGSGSLDAIFWSQFSINSKKKPSLNYTAITTFSMKGKNKNYLGNQAYRFGDEFVAIAGASDQFITGNLLWGATFQVLFRYASQDKSNEEKTPGTGGKWVFIRPGLSIKPVNKLSINMTTNIPVYSWVRDTQLTPTIRINAGIYYEIYGKEE